MSSTIVTISLPSAEFALYETLSRVEDVVVEVERVVAHDEDVVPYLWASGGDLDTFESALDDDPTVDGVVHLDDLEDGRFYRMNWVSNAEFLLDSMMEYEATVLNARGQAEEWRLRLLFPDHDSVSSFGSFFTSYDFGAQVESVHELSETKRYGQFDLSAEQYDTLKRAYEAGYYECPREASLRDLAESFGVSHQAVSQRLTRGHRHLVENALLLGENGPAD